MLKAEKKRYQELDALRGIAALLVIAFHFTQANPHLVGFKYGVTGVDLFFIISGFVIFMSLDKINNSIDFIINRLSRLYPTYWASVTFTFILLSIVYLKNNHAPYHSIIQYGVNMTMFQYYTKVRDLDSPYWTMIIEMVFYIGVLLLYHFKGLKYIKTIGVALILFMSLITHLFSGAFWVNRLIEIIPLLQFVPLFFAGIVFYKINTDKKFVLKNYLLIFLCLICQISLYKNAGISNWFISQVTYGTMLCIYFSLFILFVNGKLKFIVNNATLFLGKISFALYLTHNYLLVDIVIPFCTHQLHLNFWVVVFVIALPIAIAVASFITYLIEIPLGRKMKKTLQLKLYPIFIRH